MQEGAHNPGPTWPTWTIPIWLHDIN